MIVIFRACNKIYRFQFLVLFLSHVPELNLFNCECKFVRHISYFPLLSEVGSLQK
jgi:hypothetical protein